MSPQWAIILIDPVIQKTATKTVCKRNANRSPTASPVFFNKFTLVCVNGEKILCFSCSWGLLIIQRSCCCCVTLAGNMWLAAVNPTLWAVMQGVGLAHLQTSDRRTMFGREKKKKRAVKDHTQTVNKRSCVIVPATRLIVCLRILNVHFFMKWFSTFAFQNLL